MLENLFSKVRVFSNATADLFSCAEISSLWFQIEADYMKTNISFFKKTSFPICEKKIKVSFKRVFKFGTDFLIYNDSGFRFEKL